MIEAPITTLARQRAPQALSCRPGGENIGLVWDAVAGLPNPPTVPVIVHWTGLDKAKVEKAVERLLRRGLIAGAGRVTSSRVSYQSYRLAEIR